MIEEPPQNVVDAVTSKQPHLASMLIQTSIEEAKFAALSHKIEQIYSDVFSGAAIPEFIQKESYMMSLWDHMVEMATHIHLARPDVAQVLFEATRSQGIELEEAVTLKRRSHLTLVSESEDPKTPPDPSVLVP